MLDPLTLYQCGALVALVDHWQRQRNMSDDNGACRIDQICRELRSFPAGVTEVSRNHNQSRELQRVWPHTEYGHRSLRHYAGRRVFTKSLCKLAVMMNSHHQQLGVFLLGFVNDCGGRIA